MASVQALNPKAEVVRRNMALEMNIQAARGLQAVLQSNFGPRGTQKMLVSGAGDIKITKDGAVLLHEMQITHPTAALIARTATAQDDATGDGTTACIVLIGELLSQAQHHLSAAGPNVMNAQGDSLHPRAIVEGFEAARNAAIEFLNSYAVPIDPENREIVQQVVRCSLQTKLQPRLVQLLTPQLTEALYAIRSANSDIIDLNMVEFIAMQHRTSAECELVKGIVMDHGGRHAAMPTRLQKACILTMNVSLEYEPTELSAVATYKTASERAEMAKKERSFIDKRARLIADFKREFLEPRGYELAVLNQKGIDPDCLDVLAAAHILGLRRVKRRNMERLTLACGGRSLNTLDELEEALTKKRAGTLTEEQEMEVIQSTLGYAGLVYETQLGDEKFTVVCDVRNPKSVTLLLKASSRHEIVQIKDAIRDGLRAAKNAVEDRKLVPGAGGFEVAAARYLQQKVSDLRGQGNMKIGFQAFAEALLVLPKTLAQNSGFGGYRAVIRMQEALEDKERTVPVGLDITTGGVLDPVEAGIWDNYRVKHQLLHSTTVIACQLLLVDEIIRAGRRIGGDAPAE